MKAVPVKRVMSINLLMATMRKLEMIVVKRRTRMKTILQFLRDRNQVRVQPFRARIPE